MFGHKPDSEATQILKRMFSNWSRPPDPEVLEKWGDRLTDKGITRKTLIAACEELIDTSKYPPVFSELYSECIKYQGEVDLPPGCDICAGTGRIVATRTSDDFRASFVCSCPLGKYYGKSGLYTRWANQPGWVR